MSQSREQVGDLNLDRSSELEYRCARLAEALRGLKDLLDQYSPTWYTEAEYEKASAALDLSTNATALPCGSEQFRDAVVRS